MASLLESFNRFVSSATEWAVPPTTCFLAKEPLSSAIQNSNQIVTSCFQNLNSNQKDQVYGKVWELAKMIDPRINGTNWGQEHVNGSIPRLAIALHRLGYLNHEKEKLHAFSCLSYNFGEGGLGSQYLSLGEKLGRDPLSGQVGYVNGMGCPTLDHVGRDAACFSDRFLDGNNVHCVYHATHQTVPNGDIKGFIQDALRMKAVDGGSYTKTSYLIAQQWIDYLNANPGKNFLQIAHSEGAAHVNAALRLVKEAQPTLLARIRVLTFCPAHYIMPETYSSQLQVINFVKKEDAAVNNPTVTGASLIGSSPHIKVVPHTGDHPHNHLSDDYLNASRGFIREFMCSGNLQ